MIISFSCKETQNIYTGGVSRRWRSIQSIIERKLQLLDSAVSLNALRSPPGNRLEALTRNRAVHHSIRVNRQWRICFVWSEAGPFNVEIIDYH